MKKEKNRGKSDKNEQINSRFSKQKNTHNLYNKHMYDDIY